MKNKITLLLICLFLISSGAMAQIGSDNKQVLTFNWSRIEDKTPVGLLDKEVTGGDANKDGAVLLKANTSTPELQGVQCLLQGTPRYLEQIDLEAKIYQAEASFVKIKMQLFDITDNILLAETPIILCKGQGTIVSATLPYTFKPSSIKDQIAVRFVRADDLNPVRVLAIDCLKVNGRFVKMKQ